MKKLLLIISLFCIATTMSAQKTKTLEILHTNDTHSCILPLNPNLADIVVAIQKSEIISNSFFI